MAGLKIYSVAHPRSVSRIVADSSNADEDLFVLPAKVKLPVVSSPSSSANMHY